jgi:hypothetical protein
MMHHFPHGTPSSLLSLLTNHHSDCLGHECALAILCAFNKTLHLIHFLTNPAKQKLPPDRSEII